MDNENNASADQQGNVDSLQDLLSGIKREDGSQKYASVEEALKGASHSQQFIQTLQAEGKEKDAALEDKDNKIVELVERVQKLEAASETFSQIMNKPEVETPVMVEDQTQPQKEEAPDIASLVQQQMVALEQKKVQEANLKKVMGELSASHGQEGIEAALREGMQTHGMSEDTAMKLASESPEAFLALFNKKTNSGSQKPSSIRTVDAITEPPAPSLNLRGKSSKDQVELFKLAREQVEREFGFRT